ncbi:MAG: single-stranded DNA-binding protein [Deferribacterales bacterium]
MAYVNQLIILGNLTKDSDLRFLPGSDIAVCSFTLATTRPNKDKDKEKPIYIDVEVWREYGEAMHKHLTKGRQVIILGEIDYKVWEKDGKTQSKHIIVADSVQLLSKPKSNSSSEAEGAFDEPDADHGGTNEKTKKQTKNEKTE